MPKTYAQAKAALEASPQQYASTISGEIERIEDSKIVIVNKLNTMTGLASSSSIDEAALDLDAITVHTHDDSGDTPGVTVPDVTLVQGQTWYPTDFYDGTFIVKVDGQGSDLQSKTITWNKSTYSPQSSHTVTPDNGYYGLSQVVIPAIPEDYQDVSAVTAIQDHVLSGDVFVRLNSSTGHGEQLTGSMPNNGTVTRTLDASKSGGVYNNYSYTVPRGYHSGSGTVSISIEDISVTLSSSAQTITPTSGKVIGQVTVPAVTAADWLPGWTSGATASASQILYGETAYTGSTTATIGTMPNKGNTSYTLDASTTQRYIQEGYYDGTGTVSISTENKTISWSDISGHPASGQSTTWTIGPSSGKVINQIIIDCIPANWVDTTLATNAATANDILASKHAFVNGSEIVGTIATVENYGKGSDPVDIAKGDVTDEILASGATARTTLNSFSEAFYKNGGEITITNAIYNRLAAI